MGILSGERVLIDNQLKPSDHIRLGLILTKLAGVEAKSVVWIARRLREPHRSATRWLNEHTGDDFAFFAGNLPAVSLPE